MGLITLWMIVRSWFRHLEWDWVLGRAWNVSATGGCLVWIYLRQENGGIIGQEKEDFMPAFSLSSKPTRRLELRPAN